MKKLVQLFLVIFMGISFTNCTQSESQEESSPSRLWFTKPAEIWEEALPIGNGRLGAMIYGGIEKDQIQFNEETLWTGEPRDYSHPGAASYLDEIRQLVWAGKQDEAEELANEKFMSIPLRQLAYQPFGELYLSFHHKGEVSNYVRQLNLSNAVATTSYSVGDTKYTREYLTSAPDQTIAIQLKADKDKAITFDLSLSALHEGFITTASENGEMVLNVQVKDGALFGEAKLKLKLKGGEFIVSGNEIKIKNADEATIFLVAATNFVNPKDVSGNPKKLCSTYLTQLGNKTFKEVKKAHITDYQQYYNRFDIDFGKSIYEDLPTNERIQASTEKMDNALAALYVQFGRYLLLSSSRPGTYPANLQGIWNHKIKPSWDSKYTCNINAEMNYWPAEPLNISECHQAFYKMVEEVVETGQKVAKTHYDARGWVLHHNTDIWRGAAPINNSNHGIWQGGSGWVSHHYWEHFLYSRDTSFLANRAWPVLKGAARFYVDYLVKDPSSGYLVSCPSNSPENGGLVSGPTMDHQIIKSLFKVCIETSEILEQDQDFADTLRNILPQIAPYKIGQFGQLQEWWADIDDTTNTHRHVSHLWGIYPGKEITWQDTPELMKAAQQSLEYRGDEGTGWSLAWKINFWARFLDGDRSWELVKMLFRPAIDTYGATSGGTYPNLFDAHPPFQIDGNFGGAAGIVEMLVQSHLDAIDILPALPSALDKGHISGVKARGGFELQMDWEEGKLQKLKVRSLAGYPLKLRYAGKMVMLKTTLGQTIMLDGELKVLN